MAGRLVTAEQDILRLARAAKRVAVLGCATEQKVRVQSLIQQELSSPERLSEGCTSPPPSRAQVSPRRHPSPACRCCKTDSRLVLCIVYGQADRPAFFVAQYLADAGLEVVPIPVYYPDVTHILNQPVYRTVAAVPDSTTLDIVTVFRR